MELKSKKKSGEWRVQILLEKAAEKKKIEEDKKSRYNEKYKRIIDKNIPGYLRKE